MSRLIGIRKVMLIEKTLKAITREGIADYIRYLFNTTMCILKFTTNNIRAMLL